MLSGAAGIGKTALLDATATRAAAQARVERIVASESEMELAYAGLQQLCGRMLDGVGQLPAPQREALEAAFGLREAAAPSPFLVGLAVLGLLTEAAGERALLCVVDDAQWLDEASARAVAFVARRLGAEGIAIVLAMRTVGEQFAELPQLRVEGLGDDDARELLRLAVPGVLDRRVRDQLIAESHGNPLALRELPRALSPVEIAGGFALTGSMPLESRIERSLLAQLEPLPAPTRTLLLLAAADPTGDPGLLWRASAALGLDPEQLDAAERLDALVVGTRVGFRHPLVRSAVYRAATPPQRRAVHAALADATSAERDPDRRAWHRASATLRPEEEVAADLERSAVRARTRGGAAAAGAFLERAAELTPAPIRRAQRLIAAAEAKHDAGAPEAALRLLDTAGDHPLTPLQQALVARLRARAGYALRRDSSAPRQLLAAAQGLEALDPVLARDTYIEALAAAIYGGRLGDADEVAAVANAILDATAGDRSRPRPRPDPARPGAARRPRPGGGAADAAARAAGLPGAGARLARAALDVVRLARRAGPVGHRRAAPPRRPPGRAGPRRRRPDGAADRAQPADAGADRLRRPRRGRGVVRRDRRDQARHRPSAARIRAAVPGRLPRAGGAGDQARRGGPRRRARARRGLRAQRRQLRRGDPSSTASAATPRRSSPPAASCRSRTS